MDEILTWLSWHQDEVELRLSASNDTLSIHMHNVKTRWNIRDVKSLFAIGKDSLSLTRLLDEMYERLKDSIEGGVENV